MSLKYIFLPGGDRMITQIDHIEIIVRDVKEHVEFYQKLGFKLLGWTDHHGGSAELQLPGPNQPILEIHSVIDEENIGINHIAFKTDDLIKTYDELKEKGIAFSNEPYRNRHTGRGNVRLRDPDGWRLQMCDGQRREPEKGVPESEVKDSF
jgi:catechol 2,3-dioxygenase-like lactoylglutathione lyase family enzyme